MRKGPTKMPKNRPNHATNTSKLGKVKQGCIVSKHVFIDDFNLHHDINDNDITASHVHLSSPK